MSKTLTAVIGETAKQIILDEALTAARGALLSPQQLGRVHEICEGSVELEPSLMSELEELLPGIKLKIAAGLMCRHSRNRQELIQRIRDGQLGEVQLIRAYRMQPVGPLGRRPPQEKELMWPLRKKLAIDLKAQARYLDVFSIMPYHARFGHAADPAWISRQTAWLSSRLGVKGDPGERHKIWPIVQLADWGEAVPLDQVRPVLDHGTRRPATGVMVFAWGGLSRQSNKVEAMVEVFRAIKP